MIKVIENKKNLRLKGTCKICGSVFTYSARDLKFKKTKEIKTENGKDYLVTWSYPYCLKCPCCRKWIQQSKSDPEIFICVKELN